MSAVVEHLCFTVAMSDCDCNASLDSLDSGDVMTDCAASASPFSAFLQMTDLASHHFLMHPSVTGLHTFLEHY